MICEDALIATLKLGETPHEANDLCPIQFAWKQTWVVPFVINIIIDVERTGWARLPDSNVE
jgi:hypothetical protein